MGENPGELVVRSDFVVTLEYTMRFDDGELAADSDDDGLLSFIQGRGHVFPMIEQAVEGHRLQDELELVLPPSETYGEYDPDAFERLSLDLFPDDMEIFEGLELDLYDEDNDAEIEAVVVEVDGDEVVVDLNHPLAGEQLTVWLRIVGIRRATEEEIEHDHVHEEGHEFDDENEPMNGNG